MFDMKSVGENLAQHIPPHDCTNDDDCPYPAGLIFSVTKHDGFGSSEISVHKMSPSEVAAALVTTWDHEILESKPDEIPAVIAFASARELLRKAVDTLPPPPDVAAEIDDITTSLAAREEEEDGD